MTLVFSILACLFNGISVSHAQSQTSSLSPSQSTTKWTEQKVEPKKDWVSGSLRFENMQYFSSYPEAPELTRSQFVSGSVQSNNLSSYNEKRLWEFEYASDLMAGRFFSQRQTHWMINELSMGTRPQENMRVDIGRKKEQWSELDRFWKTGLFQPQYAIDALRPEEQGLTGLFIQLENDHIDFLAYWTPIFIPTMGPEIREEKGELRSDSRWYRTPSSSFTLANNVNTITYKLDIPDFIKLVSNGGQGARLKWSGRHGIWASAALADKPVNDLVLTRNVVVGTANQGRVTVQPEVARHTLWSTDVGYQSKNFYMTVSYLADKPLSPTAELEWAIQDLKPLSAYSAIAGFDFDSENGNWLGRKSSFQVGYLKVYGGSIQDTEYLGKEADFTLFEQRLKFYNAVSTQLQVLWGRISRWDFQTRFYYLYDWDQRGSIIGGELQLQVTRSWMALIGFDALGVEDESYETAQFINQYRANDRVFGGLSYVF